jgi:acetylornithine deacetylase/succinyl-diaminopimelate desuccinylase-like protein
VISTDGFVWGRGALDMKSPDRGRGGGGVRARARRLAPGARSLLVVVLVDEETGGSEGAQWLTRTHPDKVRCDYLVNEGGGGILEYGGAAARTAWAAARRGSSASRSTPTASPRTPRCRDSATTRCSSSRRCWQRLAEGQPSYADR